MRSFTVEEHQRGMDWARDAGFAGACATPRTQREIVEALLKLNPSADQDDPEFMIAHGASVGRDLMRQGLPLDDEPENPKSQTNLMSRLLAIPGLDPKKHYFKELMSHLENNPPLPRYAPPRKETTQPPVQNTLTLPANIKTRVALYEWLQDVKKLDPASSEFTQTFQRLSAGLPLRSDISY